MNPTGVIHVPDVFEILGNKLTVLLLYSFTIFKDRYEAIGQSSNFEQKIPETNSLIKPEQTFLEDKHKIE